MGPTNAIIDHNNLRHNFNLIRSAVGSRKIMTVVKADAYGHGILDVAKTFVKEGADYLGVAFAEEGMALRENNFNTPILVFGAQLSDFFENHLRYNLDLTLTNHKQIRDLERICRKLQKKARVQIKVDTGMGRVGFRHESFLKHLDELFNASFMNIVGIYTHFASADENDLTYTQKQLQRFEDIRHTVHHHYDSSVLFHAANSAAIMRLPQAHLDMVRPGIMLYGNPPAPDFPLEWDLKEAMTFASKIGLIKKLPAGEPVSYNRRYYAKDDMLIAIVPVGYADGYNRRFTNTGEVLINGRRHSVIGTVCMDQIVVNLNNDWTIGEGDEVVLFGRQQEAHITIKEVAHKLETIPYEVTCWISGRVNRSHRHID